MEDPVQGDICRVCRSEGTNDRPLYHPCVCTGSIRYIHQECLLQWLKYSKKEYCELCKHRFSFQPIYSPDMPKRLSFHDLIGGLLKSISTAVRFWFHYTLVALAWLGVVPLTACRIYRCLFTGSVNSLLTLPLDMLSTENLVADCLQGCFVVACTLCAFVSLVWLREQIMNGGVPDWLEQEQAANNNNEARADPAAHNAEMAARPGQNEEAQPADVDAAERINDVNHNPDHNDAPANVQDAPADDQNGNADARPNRAQEENWNQLDWAEELTWERLLGLDGSLIFLEHVFWVVSLNTLFILVFAFCPYHIGHFTIVGFKLNRMAIFKLNQFEGFLTTIVGYVVVALVLVILHTAAVFSRFRRFYATHSNHFFGMCYIVVKVTLLVLFEIGIFPLVCGWWLDLCSLNMFNATLKQRVRSLHSSPGTSMFVHWLAGMVFVFYFASFILLLREVLRPGVLWFLRNLNDPDFNPIHEMIHLPIYRHIRRFFASVVIFGSSVILMLWMPVRVIKLLMPFVFPYNVMLSNEAPVSELSLELLLLQVVLPALLEQGHARNWLKSLIRLWCIALSYVLNLRSYLLGDVPLDPASGQTIIEGDGAEPNIPAPQQPNHEAAMAPGEVPAPMEPEVPADLLAELDQPHRNPLDPADAEGIVDIRPNDVPLALPAPADPAPPVADQLPPPPAAPAAAPPVQLPAGLAAVHQAMLQGGGPIGFQPYARPSYFQIKLLALFVSMCFSLFVISLISLVVPVTVGRLLMSLWVKNAKIHELYTAACGLYTCWALMRLFTLAYNWVPQSLSTIVDRCKIWSIIACKTAVVASILLGAVPLLLGLLFQLVVVVPIRVPLDQTPIFFPCQDWALGVLHAKIILAATMMGPPWWLKTTIEQVYNQGVRNMDLVFILKQLCLPITSVLSLFLAIPYVIAHSVVPLLGGDIMTQLLVARRIYPSILVIFLIASLFVFQIKQFKKLYEHIKNDKYLVGQRLVNYDKPSYKMSSSQPPLVLPAPLRDQNE